MDSRRTTEWIGNLDLDRLELKNSEVEEARIDGEEAWNLAHRRPAQASESKLDHTNVARESRLIEGGGFRPSNLRLAGIKDGIESVMTLGDTVIGEPKIWLAARRTGWRAQLGSPFEPLGLLEVL
uniref:Uncharacterized protein n=1 Tax=Solanum tuberosum TaxID=4113 RepID=M1DIA5_SOLTU